MKRLALAGLILVFAFKSVSACFYFRPDDGDPNWDLTRSLAVSALIVGNILLYYRRGKHDLLVIAATIFCTAASFVFLGFAWLMESCQLYGQVLSPVTYVFAVLSVVQVGLFVTGSSLDVGSRKRLKLPSIK